MPLPRPWAVSSPTAVSPTAGRFFKLFYEWTSTTLPQHTCRHRPTTYTHITTRGVLTDRIRREVLSALKEIGDSSNSTDDLKAQKRKSYAREIIEAAQEAQASVGGASDGAEPEVGPRIAYEMGAKLNTQELTSQRLRYEKYKLKAQEAGNERLANITFEEFVKGWQPAQAKGGSLGKEGSVKNKTLSGTPAAKSKASNTGARQTYSLSPTCDTTHEQPNPPPLVFPSQAQPNAAPPTGNTKSAAISDFSKRRLRDLLLQLRNDPGLWGAVTVTRKTLTVLGLEPPPVTPERRDRYYKADNIVSLLEMAAILSDDQGLTFRHIALGQGSNDSTTAKETAPVDETTSNETITISNESTTTNDLTTPSENAASMEAPTPDETSNEASSNANTNTPTTLSASTNPSIAPPKLDLAKTTRIIMRQIPHAVTVITASSPQPLPKGAHKTENHHAMTVSSFNTVSLAPTPDHPYPLVSFNIKLPSTTYSAIRDRAEVVTTHGYKREGEFLAHLMPATRTAAAIANFFAGGSRTVSGEEAVFKKLEQEYPSVRLRVDAPSRAPIVGIVPASQKNITIPAVSPIVLRCRLLRDKELMVGDHAVVVAEVLDVVAGEEVNTDAWEGLGVTVDGGRLRGLIYVDGMYRRSGKQLKWEEDKDTGAKTQLLEEKKAELRPEKTEDDGKGGAGENNGNLFKRTPTGNTRLTRGEALDRYNQTRAQWSKTPRGTRPENSAKDVED